MKQAHIPATQQKRKSWQLAATAVLSLSAVSAWATPCGEVIDKIDAKIKARGITGYSLQAVPVDDVGGRRVVGTCDVGASKIIFERTPATALAAAPAPAAETPAAGTAVTATTVAQGTVATAVSSPAVAGK